MGRGVGRRRLRGWAGQWGQRKERKGGNEVCNGTGPVPQVPLRQGSRVGGAGEDMGGVMGGSSAGGAEVVRGSANQLQVVVEG